MAVGTGPIRYRYGTVEIDAEGILFRKSPGHFLAAQRARWQGGGIRSRAGALLRVLWMVSGSVVTLLTFATALGLNPWTRMGTAGRVMQAAMGVMLVLVLWDSFRSRHVPFDRLDGGVTVRGARSIYLRSRAFGRWQSLGHTGEQQRITFLDSADRNRVVRLLDRHGVDTSYDRRATRATYKLVRAGGGYFCPACDTRVSVDDTSCPACGERLTDGTHLPEWERESAGRTRGKTDI